MMKLQLSSLVFDRIQITHLFSKCNIFLLLLIVLCLPACNDEGAISATSDSKTGKQPVVDLAESVESGEPDETIDSVESLTEVVDVTAVEQNLVDPIVIPLIAGQHIEVGSITVTNNETSIVIVYETTGEWGITETHVDVAVDYSGLHTTGSGNPQPGKFDQQTSHPQPVMKVTHVIDDLEWSVGMDIYIATHAVVVSQQGDETAWAGDLDFPGRNWATYFTYVTQEQKNENLRGQLQFGQAIYETAELGRSRKNLVQIEVQRIGGSEGDISARYSIVGGTATLDSDYVIETTSEVLEFLDGETSKIISIIILDDNEYEQYVLPYETIDLVLEDSCCLGTQQATQVQIFDDEELN